MGSKRFCIKSLAESLAQSSVGNRQWLVTYVSNCITVVSKVTVGQARRMKPSPNLTERCQKFSAWFQLNIAIVTYPGALPVFLVHDAGFKTGNT